MGTRSAIDILNKDGSVLAVYCHWDGYPSYVGRLLVENYTTEAKVRELLALGDISSLGKTIGEKHDFDGPHDENITTFYGRDRGEENVAAETCYNSLSYSASASKLGCEWVYLFTEKGWVFGDGSPVADAIARKSEEEN